MGRRVLALVLLLCLIRDVKAQTVNRGPYSCSLFDARTPVACYPAFENVALNLLPVATSICGLEREERVCSTSASGRDCSSCDVAQEALAHLPEHMTDGDSLGPRLDTYWQSQPFPTDSVNVTLSFNRTFEVHSVRVAFVGSRPESFTILKSSDFGQTFSPFHYFSRSCSETYRIAENVPTAEGSVPFCSSDGVGLTPLSGGQAVFYPLQHQPLAGYLDLSPELQAWVRATDIRLQLDRLSTFGDELTQDSEVLASYSYAIADVEVRARCVCNGHAAVCSRDSNWQCICQHNTEGESCQRCLPSHNQLPWEPATLTSAGVCRACQCSNHSEECTPVGGEGGGALCLNCRDNTTGDGCERCRDGYQPTSPFSSEAACSVAGMSVCSAGQYGLSAQFPDECRPCNCHRNGTEGGSADTCDISSGQCPCLPGVGGRDCSECLPGFYGSPNTGCRECGCHTGGATLSNCSQDNGNCICRDGVTSEEGGRLVCDSILPGHYCPALDYYLFEAEDIMASPSSIVLADGEYSTGAGYLQIGPRDSFASNNISLPAAGYYQLVFRYSTEDNAENSVIRFSISTLGDLTVPPSAHLPCNPNLVVNGTVAVTEQGGGRAVRVPEHLCLLESSLTSYVITVSMEELWGYFLLDSFLLIPDLSSLAVFGEPGSLLQFISQGCLDNQLALRTRDNVLAGVCGEQTCAAMLEVLDGAAECECDSIGSTGQCTFAGCECLPGVGGRQCERCLLGFSNFSSAGCQRCDCDPAGSEDQLCDSTDGNCVCKANVVGERCQMCAPGSYGLEPSRREGCELCMCFGHAASCEEATDTRVALLEYEPASATDWYLSVNGIVQEGEELLARNEGLEILSSEQPLFLHFPTEWVQSLRRAQEFVLLSFTVGTRMGQPLSGPPVVSLTAGSVTFQHTPSLPLPSQPTTYMVSILNPLSSDRWYTQDGLLTDPTALQRALPLLDALTISVPSSNTSVLFSELHSEYWLFSSSPGPRPQDVEQCTCDQPYTGLSCQFCAEGYYREMLSVSAFTDCTLCQCGERSSQCDPFSGVCLNCGNNTAGEHCERCLPGHFRYNANECVPCPCPVGANAAASCEVNGSQVTCLDCREGHVGDSCEQCAPGYFGDPSGDVTGTPLPCSQCDCNGNADPLLLQPCDPVSGVCQACLFNTVGDFCQACAPGYFGTAVKGNCTACSCSSAGTDGGICDPLSGACLCLPNTSGDQCERCPEGSHLIVSGECVSCPACYERVALEFNDTLSLYQELLSRIDMSGGGIGEGLLGEIERYRNLLNELLDRSLEATRREDGLYLELDSVVRNTSGLADLIGDFGLLVSVAEEESFLFTQQVQQQEDTLLLLHTLLVQLEQAVLLEVEPKLLAALRLHEELQTELRVLVNVSYRANLTSYEQLQEARALLRRTEEALGDSMEALRLLCWAISLQNATVQDLEYIEQERLPNLQSLFLTARSALSRAQMDIPPVFLQSKEILQRAQNIVVANYRPELLRVQLTGLQVNTSTLNMDTAAVDREVDSLQANVSALLDEARALLNESDSLNNIANNLLTRAHAALAFANDSVRRGEDIYTRGDEILLELRQRLMDVSNLTRGLEELLRQIEEAEELSGRALKQAREEAERLMDVMKMLEEATGLLERINNQLRLISELVQQANSTASSTLTNAEALRNSATELSSNVAVTNSTITSLEDQADRDRNAITDAHRYATDAVQNASSLIDRIEQLRGSLVNLSRDLNATDLVSPVLLDRVRDNVTALEVEAAQNEVAIEGVKEKVEQLQLSAQKLQERYRALLQHRTVLEEILDNIDDLDCRNQFVPSS